MQLSISSRAHCPRITPESKENIESVVFDMLMPSKLDAGLVCHYLYKYGR